MRLVFLCKRHYTNKDLLEDRFGRLFHLPVQLSRLGSAVSVLALDYRSSSPRAEQFEGVAFRTIPMSVAKLPSVLLHLRRTITSLKPSIIIASGDSHIGYVGKYLAAHVGARFAFDVYDYYPAFPGNRIPGMHVMFDSAVKRADLILCASTPLLKKLHPISAKAVLVENGVDRHLFAPMDKRRARAAVGLAPGNPVIGYFGSVTPDQGPLLFKAVRQLTVSFPGIRVLIAGSVKGCELNEPFIVYKGLLPQKELPQLIAACDVVTVPYARSPQIDMSGACKIAEYLACARPIVATRVAAHDEVLLEVPQSLCEPNASDLASAISRQLNEQAVAPFPDELDWRHIGKRLSGELLALLQ